jgi:NAD(P)-dependent dehydrogenase (short-subunit alcohol dehydrogenase family)
VHKKEDSVEQRNGLHNKRVVILGGSSGIGLAVAEQAASSSESRREVGGNAQGHTLDLMDESAVENFFAKLGAFDHLVFTAGDQLRLHDLAATNLQQARRAFELRYWAALGNNLPVGRVGEAQNVAQACLFLMQEEFSTGQTLVVDGRTVLV